MIALSKFLPLLLTIEHNIGCSVFLLTKNTRIELEKSGIVNFYDSEFIEKLFYNIDILNFQITLKFNDIYLKNNKEKCNNYVLASLELKSCKSHVYVKKAVVILHNYNTYYKQQFPNISNIYKNTEIEFFCIQEEIDKINSNNKRKPISIEFRDTIQSTTNPTLDGFYEPDGVYTNYMNYNFYYYSNLFNKQININHYFEFNLLNFKEKIDDLATILTEANIVIDKKIFRKYRKILKSRNKQVMLINSPMRIESKSFSVCDYLKIESIFKKIEVSNIEDRKLKKLYELLKVGGNNFNNKDCDLTTIYYSGDLFIIVIVFKELQLKIICNDRFENLEFLNLIYSEKLVNRLEKSILLGDLN